MHPDSADSAPTDCTPGADLFTLYNRAGLKGEGIVFLFTDQHVVDERMLVHFNDMLSSGRLPDLYSAEDKDNIVNAIRPEVKSSGVILTTYY